MPGDASGATSLAEIDRFDGGIGWLAYPDEPLQRASHAVAVDGEVWVLDPVDAPGVDDLLSGLAGDLAGTVVCLDRHRRDAAEVAARHGVPVHVPDWMTGVAAGRDAPVERFGRTLGGFRAITIRDAALPRWQEVGLYDEEGGTLYVPEAVGTAPHMVTGGERLGVHPALRLTPPRRALSGLDPERVLVGHGRGIVEGGGTALASALRSSRRNAPALWAQQLRTVLGRLSQGRAPW